MGHKINVQHNNTGFKPSIKHNPKHRGQGVPHDSWFHHIISIGGAFDGADIRY